MDCDRLSPSFIMYDMAYQYKREPLTADEATELAILCETHEEKLVVWTLLDSGLRVNELARLVRKNIGWQGHRLMIYGKGGPYGSKTKRRVIPLSTRIRPLIEGHYSINETLGMTARTIQRLVKRVANRARISRPVSPHVLRHTSPPSHRRHRRCRRSDGAGQA